MKNIYSFILTILLLIFLSGCHDKYGYIDSKFEIPPDSDLPKFIEIPEGYSRKDITITVTFYTPYKQSTNDTVIKILGPPPDNKIIKEIVGVTCTNQIIIEQEKKRKLGTLQYPRYICISVNGVEEMFEIRGMNNDLYVSDVLQKK